LNENHTIGIPATNWLFLDPGTKWLEGFKQGFSPATVLLHTEIAEDV